VNQLRPIALAACIAVFGAPGGARAAAGIPVLSVSAVVTPGAGSVGQPLTVMLSVANLGTVTVTEVSSVLGLGGGATAVVVAVPEAGVRPVLGPGEQVATGWGVVGTAPGRLEFTMTVAGVWVSGGRTHTGRAIASASAIIRTPPRLKGAWTGPPAGWCARRPFPVSLAVSNAGEADAAGVAVAVPPVEGTAGATLLAGPSPEAVTVPGGGTATFTWTLAGARGGTVWFTATVTGVDAGSGAPVAASTAGEWTLAGPGEAAASLAVHPEVSHGQWCAIVLTVTNAGGYAITDLEASLAGSPGAGWVRSGPPPVPARELAPGEARRFVWSWSVTGLGDLSFESRMACATCDGFLPLAARVSATTLAVRPAALAASLSVSATQIVSGQAVTLVLALTNTGGAAARRVTALVPTPSTSRSSLVAGPLRVTLESLPGGSSTVFGWTWTVTGQGSVGFVSRVDGRDGNARWGLSSGILDAPRVRVLTPASLKIERFALFPSPAIISGVFLTASLVITNRGETPALLSELEVKETKAPADVLGPASMFFPRIPSDLPAGDSASVVWIYRTGVWGTASVSATVFAVEPATGRKLAALHAVSNRITVTAWAPPAGIE